MAKSNFSSNNFTRRDKTILDNNLKIKQSLEQLKKHYLVVLTAKEQVHLATNKERQLGEFNSEKEAHVTMQLIERCEGRIEKLLHKMM